MSRDQAALPRPRTVVHPGPVDALRVDARCAGLARHFRLVLPAGLSLFDAVSRALDSAGVRSASMTLFDGDWSELIYFLGQEDKTGQVVANYGEPQVARAARLITGNATLGRSASNEPFLHCHAMFRLADGSVRGGHVQSDRTVLGAHPTTVFVTTLDGFDPCITLDAETRLGLFRPLSAAEQEASSKGVCAS